MLDFGVINDQSANILQCADFIVNSGRCSAAAMKYGLICFQFVLHSKSESQWNTDPDTEKILGMILNQCVNIQKELVQKQAIKSMCIILQN